MTVTFENDNDVILFALEKVISYTRRTQQIFVAQCVWWLASIIGHEQGLINHIDNLENREGPNSQRQEAPEEVPLPSQIHPNRVPQISDRRSVSAILRDLTEDQRLDQILVGAKKAIQESIRDRNTLKRNRVNSLPSTKAQLKKAWKTKSLQEAQGRKESERQERLARLRVQVTERLTSDKYLGILKK
jgi:hypothetical protein